MNDEPVLMQAEQTSLGATLKALRCARQLELTDVSLHLKFAARQLQALEEEDWARLPTGLPLRGMVKNYAKFLQADSAALLVMLNAQTGAGTAAVAHVSTPASLGDADAAYHVRHGAKSWVWMAVILLVVLMVGGYAIERGWIPESWRVFDWLRPADA